MLKFSRQIHNKLVMLFWSKKRTVWIKSKICSDTKYFVTCKGQDVFKYVFHVHTKYTMIMLTHSFKMSSAVFIKCYRKITSTLRTFINMFLYSKIILKVDLFFSCLLLIKQWLARLDVHIYVPCPIIPSSAGDTYLPKNWTYFMVLGNVYKGRPILG